MVGQALYAGPTLFYSGSGYFLILNYQPQIKSLQTSGLDLDEYERGQIRFLIGFTIK